MAYGVGLPAFVLVRCVVPSFYARHDTATPVRATVVSGVVNIALKMVMVWGLNFGVIGIALGTSLAAWVNVGMLVVMARRRGSLTINNEFRRALVPVLLAAAATGGAAWFGARLVSGLHAGWRDEAMLGSAVLFGVIAYMIVILPFRKLLPLGKISR
jgi:putative peptidoglycan lipid II flippase